MRKKLVAKLLTFLGIELSEVDPLAKWTAIPFNQARLCINCEHIVESQVCPVCGSKTQLFIGKVLGEEGGNLWIRRKP